MNGVEFSFNWFYADDRDIAFYSSGRLPVRAPGTDPALPTVGTGDFDWRGFLPFAGHARGINPPSGVILNWNNKPAVGVGSADTNFAYGSVHRVELLTAEVGKRRKHTLASVTAAMNKAATQDLRATQVWPRIRAVLATGPAPSARAEAAALLLDTWVQTGASRVDRELDGRIDAAGAAVMDAAWPRLADAVMSPILGPLLDRLASLHTRSDDAGPGGSAYISGWYGYVDKDLRTLLGRPVRGEYSRRYCGAGVLATCRESLWSALDAAAAELEVTRGAAPSGWWSESAPERIGSRPEPDGHDALDESADLPAGRSDSPGIARAARREVAPPDRSRRGARDARLGAVQPRKRYLMAPGPTPVPARGAGSGGGADHPPPRLGLPRADAPLSRPAAGGVPHAERRPRVHGVRLRWVRVGGRESRLAGRPGPRRLRG